MVKSVLEEAGSQALKEFLRDRANQISSVLSRIEASRALHRRQAAPRYEPRLHEVLEVIDLLPIDQSIVESACRLAPALLHSLDAIHLASALTLGPDLEGLVTYDRRLADAASQLGVRVFSPGSDN